jgi:hypothetical protein
MEERFIDDPIVQIKTSTNLENGEKYMIVFLNYMFKEKFGKLIKNLFLLIFFYVNDK